METGSAKEAWARAVSVSARAEVEWAALGLEALALELAEEAQAMVLGNRQPSRKPWSNRCYNALRSSRSDSCHKNPCHPIHSNNTAPQMVNTEAALEGLELGRVGLALG